MAYRHWRAGFKVEVISPFCNRYVCARREDRAELPTEIYEDPPWLICPHSAEVVDEQALPFTPSQERYLTELERRSPFRISEERIHRFFAGQRPYSPEELSRSAYARAADRLVQLEQQYFEISHNVALSALRDPLHHPTATETEIVRYLREKLETARDHIRRIQRRDVMDSQRLACEMTGRSFHRE